MPNIKFILLLFSIIFLLIYLIIIHEVKLEDYFYDNLSAELLGILIEILIIIFVFERWKKIEQHKKNIVYEKRLREYLLFFLQNSFKNLPKGIKVTTFYGKDYLRNKKEIEEIVNYISDNNVHLLDAKKHLLTDKTAYENLLEVASNLTDKHFKVWIRIVYFINTLSTVSDDENEEIKKNIIHILNKIKRFDKASYESGIYVDSNKSYSCFSNISKIEVLLFIIVLFLNINFFMENSITKLINENSFILIENKINYIYNSLYSFFIN